jgi:hypothetical protein
MSTRKNISPFCGLVGNLVPNPAVDDAVEVDTLSASSSVKAKFGIIDCSTGVGSGGVSLISSVTTSMA